MTFLQQHRTTIVFVISLLLLSIIVQHGRVGASIDGVDLSTDAANYAAMMAADTTPQAFVKDPAYNDADRYGVHSTFMVKLLPTFFQTSNFGLTYLQLTGVQFFLHGLAFYLLGLFLLHKKWQAILFSIIMSQAYWMPFGTYWGNGYLDYLPRSTFEIFYAFFVILALYIRNKPRLWPFFMLGIGSMAYIHSISTLPAAFGFWLGFSFCRPANTSMKKHLTWLVFCGLCFMLAIAPVVWSFLRPGITLSAEDVILFKEVLAVRYNKEFSDFLFGISELFTHYNFGVLCFLGIVSYICIAKWGDAETKQRNSQFGIWALGVFFCAMLYLLDQEMARILQRKPFEFDLIRVIRFWIFFVICIALIACNVMYERFYEKYPSHKRALISLHVMCFIVGFAFGVPHKLYASLSYYWNAADNTRYEQAYAPTLQRSAILKALQSHTQEGDLIFDSEGDRAVRYYALRSLAYSWQDCSIYFYAKDVANLRTWYDTQAKLKSSPTAYMDLAKQYNADYLISHRPHDRELLQDIGTIVWENPKALLVKLNN